LVLGMCGVFTGQVYLQQQSGNWQDISEI
jgi:hypothetical protein